MTDRFTNGFLTGFLSAFVPFVFNFGSRALGFSTLVWSDFMGLFILGRRPENTLELIYTICLQFRFLSILGSLFPLILTLISSKRYIFKGALYGITIWFILFSLPNLLQISGLGRIPLKTAISNFLGALLWGIALSFILKKIDRRDSLKISLKPRFPFRPVSVIRRSMPC